MNTLCYGSYLADKAADVECLPDHVGETMFYINTNIHRITTLTDDMDKEWMVSEFIFVDEENKPLLDFDLFDYIQELEEYREQGHIITSFDSDFDKITKKIYVPNTDFDYIVNHQNIHSLQTIQFKYHWKYHNDQLLLDIKEALRVVNNSLFNFYSFEFNASKPYFL